MTADSNNPPARKPPMKQMMALSLKSLVSSVFGGASGSEGGPAPMEKLFTKTDPAVDGDACLQDCEGCSVKYPRSFKIDESELLYGHSKSWSTHLLVGTGKTDWVRDVADEKGSVMEAVDKANAPTNGKLMLSASNLPTGTDAADYSEPTTALLFPSFTLIHNVSPSNVGSLITDVISKSPTTTSPLEPFDLGTLPDGLTTSACPHKVVILMCSQRTRDARCGQSAPLLKKELERHLRPLGLYRDSQDDRPGGVGIYFISHTGGHKFAANVLIYRRPNAFGQDEAADDAAKKTTTTEGEAETEDVGASQCIWLARIKPEDCENLVRYTVLKGKVVKPETQLRGGFDRSKGLLSW